MKVVHSSTQFCTKLCRQALKLVEKPTELSYRSVDLVRRYVGIPHESHQSTCINDDETNGFKKQHPVSMRDSNDEVSRNKMEMCEWTFKVKLFWVE